MKKLLLILLTTLSISAFAQDTTKTEVVTNFVISNKNLWRGVVYGNNSPSLQGTLGVKRSRFEIGAYATSTINGNPLGYGTWMELYTSYTRGRFTLTFDDYYFFNDYDENHDYFNWSRSTTTHLVESRLKYNVDKFNITASYVIYASKESVNALYLEAEYFIIPEFSLLAGYVTGESYLNYYNDAGVTHIGIAGYRTIKFSENFSLPVRASVITNPNYKNVAEYEGLGVSSINFILSLTF